MNIMKLIQSASIKAKYYKGKSEKLVQDEAECIYFIKMCKIWHS